MSTTNHAVECVEVQLRPHPNADTLSIADVFGWTCVVKTESWVGRTRAYYIPPDSLVDLQREEFAFLKHPLVKAMTLRGERSFGLLIPAPEDTPLGGDYAEMLGVLHYEPVVRHRGAPNDTKLGAEDTNGPSVVAPKYDLENGRRWSHLFAPGEHCIVTEKLHGCNARYVWYDGQMFCGSRTNWKREFASADHLTMEKLTPKVGAERAAQIIERVTRNPQRSQWWTVLDSTPELREYCESHPGHVVYGELYGAVQDMRYGVPKGEIRFAMFDVFASGHWLPWDEQPLIVPSVPAIYIGPFDFEQVCEMAEGQSTIADHVREGVVVRDNYRTRILKFVGAGYLAR